MSNINESTLVDVSQNNIFAFWESPNPIPAYLDLCRDTWIKNIPNCQIHVLNHSNLHKYIGNIYDLEKLKTIPFAMQSDIVSAAVLEKFGGLFLDLDCIVIDDVFDIFSKISDTKLISFGRPTSKAIHLAVLYCRTPNNPILREWRKAAQERLQNKPEKYPWHYFGNGIINPLLNKSEYKDDFYIIDRTLSGNILESVIFGDNQNRVIDDYKNLYFNEYFRLSPRVLNCVTCGVISLHNSWTPQKYKEKANKLDFLACDAPIAGLLKYILNNDTSKEYSNIFPIVESFILNNLNISNIQYSFKYFRGMLVLDFVVSGVNFAFDISVASNQVSLDFISRNTPLNIIKKASYFKQINFVNNKVRIVNNSNKENVLSEILKIHSNISENDIIVKTINSSEDVVIDLKNLNISKNKIYLEGIGIVTGQNAREYSDIEYHIILKGKNEYTKKLAKAHRPELTSLYAHNNNICYDKCWFATPNYQGIDISDVPKGSYELLLKISINGYAITKNLKTYEEINIKNSSFEFYADSKDNRLTIK